MAWFSNKNSEDKKDKKEEMMEVKKDSPVIAMPQIDDAISYHMILGPHVTEKASAMNVDGVYVFKVSKNANKIGISKAIEKLYKVTVNGVRIVNIHGKQRRVGRTIGKKSGYKKALVTLKKGDVINTTSA